MLILFLTLAGMSALLCLLASLERWAQR